MTAARSWPTDLAVSIADGGETITELAVLRDQPDLFGRVASTPTAWRTLEAVDAETAGVGARSRGSRCPPRRAQPIDRRRVTITSSPAWTRSR
jgi:hypothetical protein